MSTFMHGRAAVCYRNMHFPTVLCRGTNKPMKYRNIYVRRLNSIPVLTFMVFDVAVNVLRGHVSIIVVCMGYG